jgi:hypothetical protein
VEPMILQACVVLRGDAHEQLACCMQSELTCTSEQVQATQNSARSLFEAYRHSSLNVAISSPSFFGTSAAVPLVLSAMSPLAASSPRFGGADGCVTTAVRYESVLDGSSSTRTSLSAAMACACAATTHCGVPAVNQEEGGRQQCANVACETVSS